MDKVVQSSNQSLFTRKEAAVKLRISLPTLDKLISSQKLTSLLIGRRRLISEQHLDTLINQAGGSK
ncbi:excisionase family DNA-binding protein [Flavihumibacter profundi]|uniref:excisionase family DNA-binding protein n=1 Tax=Flavihumibacter profundi TaxID=2716883 RepID=UPI001CC3AF99|nr:excisionase family DNA-binding protein [Flavihumibacter profundi]